MTIKAKQLSKYLLKRFNRMTEKNLGHTNITLTRDDLWFLIMTLQGVLYIDTDGFTIKEEDLKLTGVIYDNNN